MLLMGFTAGLKSKHSRTCAKKQKNKTTKKTVSDKYVACDTTTAKTLFYDHHVFKPNFDCRLPTNSMQTVDTNREQNVRPPSEEPKKK